MSNQIVADLFNNPRTLGPLPSADVTGQEGHQGEGPYMAIYLKLDGELVQEARFATYGCPYAIACGSWVTQWVVGRTLDQALILEPEDVGKIMGGLPLGKEHCAELPVRALREGIRLWQEQSGKDL